MQNITANVPCIHFVPFNEHNDYINITSPEKGWCSAAVGRQNGNNFLHMAQICFNYGTVLHEILHKLGLWHEMSRPDRDKHVYVDVTEIKEGGLYFELSF